MSENSPETGDILVCRESAAFTFGGERVVIHKGKTRVRVGHPILEGREHLFEPLRVHYDVETARQEPVVPTPAPPAEQPEGDKPKRGRGNQQGA